MLGLFYEKAWDLNRQTQQDPHSFTSSSSTRNHHQNLDRKNRQPSLKKKMHLPNGNHVVRFGGVSKEPVEVKVQSNGIVKTEEHEPTLGTTLQEEAPISKANEVSIALPQDLAGDALLDTILTGWSILIQRYQRDLYHQFTWGLRDAQISDLQCIPTTDLDLLNQNTAGALKSKIGNVRSKDFNIDQATIVLNDGTQEEVRYHFIMS